MPTLVIGDLHFNHTPRGMMEAQLETVKKIVERGIVKHRCDSVIFLGDLMMHRSPRPPVMLSLKSLMDWITEEKGLHVYILRGNHDSYNKSDDGVTSLSLLENDKVTVHTQTYYDEQNNWTFIPHYEDESRIEHDLGAANPGSFVFGHFGYVGSLNSAGDADFGLQLDAFKNRTILGHIHKHTEDGQVTVLGTPYSTNFGEAGKDCYYGVITKKGFKKYPIDFGVRHLVIDYETVKNNIDWINQEDWFTLLRVTINSLEEDSHVAWTCDGLNVGFLEIKYVPLLDDRDVFDPQPGVISLQVNDDLIEQYLNASNTKINKDVLLEGLKLIHENQKNRDQ